MSRLLRLAFLTALAVALNAGLAHAAPITVAEFRWDLFTDASVPEDPFTVSFFSLTNLWDGPGSVTLFDNALVLPAGSTPFDDLDPFAFTQQTVIGAPAFASTRVSFSFEGQTISLATQLSSPDTFAVLQFDPTTVPEPGTLGLLAIGGALVALRQRRRRPS